MSIHDFVVERLGVSKTDPLPFQTRLKEVRKGDIITDYDQMETSVYFIQKGTLITYLLYREEERILDFHLEGSFCSSYSSLLTAKPSDIRIRAFTETTLEVVNYAELSGQYKTSLLANQLGRVATEGLFLQRVSREKELLTLTAEERYHSLLAKNPEVVQKIPVKELSKYLGVQPESLSRIRRNQLS